MAGKVSFSAFFASLTALMTDPSLPPTAGTTASNAVVDVFDADDVVLAEIGPRLHLDQVKRHLSRVLEPVRAAERHEDRLVLTQQDGFVVARHQRRAVDDDPVLGAVI